MKVAKYALAALTVFASVCFAGKEDWTGYYDLIDTKGNQATVAGHWNSQVQFMFITAGQSIKLSKGSQFGDYIASDNLVLAVDASVEEFEKELSKLGAIAAKEVTLGSTYHK